MEIMEPKTGCWSQDVGKLLLRLSIGGLLLCHGVDKIVHPEHFGMIKGAVASHNLPDFIAYGVYVGEVGGSLLVLVGFFTRIGAAIMAINMGVAVWLAHVPMLWTLNEGGGWALELQGLFFFGAISIMFLGAGCISIDGLLRRRPDEEVPAPAPTKPQSK
jgi:putative oxidoreductase